MVIRKPFSTYEGPKTPSGSDEVPTYTAVTLPDGGRVLKQVGSYSQKDYVQSFLEGTLLENILQKCVITGDDSLLNTRPGFYLDITGMPQDFAEVQNMIVMAKSTYENSPRVVLERYPTFEQYADAMLADPDSGDFSSLMSLYGLTKDVQAARSDASQASDVFVNSAQEGGASE